MVYKNIIFDFLNNLNAEKNNSIFSKKIGMDILLFKKTIIIYRYIDTNGIFYEFLIRY